MSENAEKQCEKSEDNEEKHEEKEWFQILAICSAALSSLSAAVLFNWTSPSIPILINSEQGYENIDISLASYLTVIPPIVTIFLSPVYAIIIDKFGRKIPLLSIAILHIFSWICVILARSIYILYLSRVFFGIADAAMFGVLPIYIAEVATPKVRGTWGNAMGIGIYLGQLIMNVIGYYLTIKASAYVLISIPVTFFILFLMMPETPYFYLMKGRMGDAEESLKKLRRCANVKKELERISTDVKKLLESKNTFKVCFTDKTNRKAVLLVSLARGMQQLAGISAFAVYTQLIFREGMPDINGALTAILYTGSLTIAGLIGSIVTDKLGRKISMIVSCLGCAICLTLESIYFYLRSETEIDLSAISWFPIIGMVVYVFIFCLGLALTPYLLLSELFHTGIRGKATCILSIIFCVYIASITKLFQFLTTNFGLYVPFGIFAVCTYGSAVLSYYFVPETRGKTLEEIQDILKGKDAKSRPV